MYLSTNLKSNKCYFKTDTMIKLELFLHKIKFFLILVCFSNSTYSQISEIKSGVSDTIYDNSDVEIPANFPGGINAFRTFVADKFNIPDSFDSGKMIIIFIVDTDGCVKNTEVIYNNLGSEFAEEALRVFELSPEWTPAQKDGTNVRMRFRMPLQFQSVD